MYRTIAVTGLLFMVNPLIVVADFGLGVGAYSLLNFAVPLTP